jgi:hypothetical protein
VWRVDGEGRRERLVLPRAELEGVAARLPDRLRAPLAPLGLANRAAPPPPPRTSTEIDQGWDDDSDAAPPPRPPERLDSAGPLH